MNIATIIQAKEGHLGKTFLMQHIAQLMKNQGIDYEITRIGRLDPLMVKIDKPIMLHEITYEQVPYACECIAVDFIATTHEVWTTEQVKALNRSIPDFQIVIITVAHTPEF